MTEEIFAQVKKLLYECWKCEPLRLIGVALTDLTSDEFRQMSLFENTEDREKQKKVDETIDDIRQALRKRNDRPGQYDQYGRKSREEGESAA